jgi:hypothetical protein
VAGSTQAGPLLTLFNEPAETITAVADRSGLVHVFAETTVGMSLLRINSSPRRAIHHFTVALDGSLQHELVEPSNRDVWGNLTAVFDAGGRLHLIFGRRYIVLGSDGWHGAPDSPRCTLLALSGSQLACVSSTFGTDQDQPFSCEAPIIYKCPSEWPRNIFIARELTDGSWSGSVLGRANGAHVAALALSGTEGNELKLVYGMYTKASHAGSEIRMWSDAPANGLSPIERSAANDAVIGSTALATSSYSFSLMGDQCAAIDAKSGSVLVIAPWGPTDAMWGLMQAVLVVPGESKPRAPLPVPENIFCVAPGNLAAAGGGRWHAVFFDRSRHHWGAGTIPLEYRDLRNDTWSVPLELGEWSIYPGGLPHTRTIWATPPVITDNGSGQALIVWNSGSKTLVARWVRSGVSPDATR